MKSILYHRLKGFGLGAVVLLAGVVCGLNQASAQTSASAPATPGSAVDKRLLGKWAAASEYGEASMFLDISTTPEAFALLRKTIASLANYQPQANDAALLNAKGNPTSYIRCLTLKGGDEILLSYSRKGQGNAMLGGALFFTPNDENPTLIIDSPLSPPSRQPLQLNRVLSDAEMQQPEHSPGGLVDSILLGKWIWINAEGQPMENIEISASVDAYKQFASFAKFSPLWRAPANEAVGLNPLRQYVTILQFYTLEDGSKIMLIWAQDLWCFKYAKKGDGIELTSLGWDSNPVMHLRPLTPDEIQKGNMAVNDKAVQNNLRQLFSAAQQYMLDKGVSSVSYAELIVNRADNFGSKTPIEGEDYTKLIFTSSQTEVIVELPDGREIKYSQ